MNLWQQLITEMLWHLIIISASLLFVSLLSNFLYERLFHRPYIQFVLNITANFFAVVATLILLAAFISAAIEGMGNYLLIIGAFIIIGFVISIKVYKGD